MKILFLLFTVCLLLFVSGCEEKKEIHPSSKVIRVGLLAPLSRVNRKYGYQSLIGMKFANKEAAYLSNGDKIIFEIVDTNSSVLGTQKGLEYLIEKNVTAIISFVSSHNMLALKDLLHNITTPMIVTLATNDEITKLNNSISQICMSNQREALVAAHYIKDEKFINSAGIVYNSTNPYSLSLAIQFREYYKKIRGEDTFFINFANKNAIQKLRSYDMHNIEMLFSSLDAKESVTVLKVIQHRDVDILLSDGTLSDAKENTKSELALFNGAYIIEHYASNMKKSRAYKGLQKILKEDALEDSSYAFLAYDAYALLYYTLQNCPNYEQKCINALFQNSDIIQGIAGNFNMQNAKVKRKIYIDKIKDLRLIKEVVTY